MAVSGYARMRIVREYGGSFSATCPACGDWTYCVTIAVAQTFAHKHWRECPALQRDRLVADLEARMEGFATSASYWIDAGSADHSTLASYWRGRGLARREDAETLRQLLAEHREQVTS